MPRTVSLSLVLVLALASTATAAEPRAKTPHRFTSVTQLTMTSSALDYPSPKGTAVLSGTLKIDPFGDGTTSALSHSAGTAPGAEPAMT